MEGYLGLARPCFEPRPLHPLSPLCPSLRAPWVYQTWACHARQGGSPCPDLSPLLPPRSWSVSCFFLSSLISLHTQLSVVVFARVLCASFFSTFVLFLRFLFHSSTSRTSISISKTHSLFFRFLSISPFLVFGSRQRQADFEPLFPSAKAS